MQMLLNQLLKFILYTKKSNAFDKTEVNAKSLKVCLHVPVTFCRKEKKDLNRSLLEFFKNNDCYKT